VRSIGVKHHLCAPRCKGLSVHYAHSGYEVIAKLIWSAVLAQN